MGQIGTDGGTVALPNIHSGIGLPEPIREGIIEQVSSADKERFNQEKPHYPAQAIMQVWEKLIRQRRVAEQYVAQYQDGYKQKDGIIPGISRFQRSNKQRASRQL